MAVAMGCVAGSFLAGARLEEAPGPRTALARILRMLAFVVAVLLLLVAVLRPGARAAEIGGVSPLQDAAAEVE
jgi:hypothetical protein